MHVSVSARRGKASAHSLVTARTLRWVCNMQTEDRHPLSMRATPAQPGTFASFPTIPFYETMNPGLNPCVKLPLLC